MMAEWLNTPVIVLAVLAVLGIGYKVVYWIASLDTDRKALKENAEKDSAEFKEKSDRERSEILGLVREIREDIKKIFLHSGVAPLREKVCPFGLC